MCVCLCAGSPGSDTHPEVPLRSVNNVSNEAGGETFRGQGELQCLEAPTEEEKQDGAVDV